MGGQSDVITDFKRGVDFLKFGSTVATLTLDETFSGDGTDAEFRFNTKTQRLFCDVDSAGTADFTVELLGLTSVSLPDLYLKGL